MGDHVVLDVLCVCETVDIVSCVAVCFVFFFVLLCVCFGCVSTLYVSLSVISVVVMLFMCVSMCVRCVVVWLCVDCVLVVLLCCIDVALMI